MHQVLLQRTRPAPQASAPPDSQRPGLFRFLSGKRALVLVALVGGAALGSQSLLGRLGPTRKSPAPTTNSSGASRTPVPEEKQPAASLDPVTTPAELLASTSSQKPPSTTAKPIPGPESLSQGSLDRSSHQVSSSSSDSLAKLRRQGTSAGLSPQARDPQDTRLALGSRSAWQSPRPPKASPGAIQYPPMSESRPISLPPRPGATSTRRPASTSLRSDDGVLRLNPMSLADLETSPSDPCDSSKPSLSWQARSPDQAAPSSSLSPQANRNIPCLPKQPAGRN